MVSVAATRTAMARYAGDAAATASPVRLLTMLYDRLCLDLASAEDAVTGGFVAEASDALLHAQAIVVELHAALDVSAWAGAPGLADLYRYVEEELVAANVTKDAARVRTCRSLLEPLRDAWHEAAQSGLGTSSAG